MLCSHQNLLPNAHVRCYALLSVPISGQRLISRRAEGHRYVRSPSRVDVPQEEEITRWPVEAYCGRTVAVPVADDRQVSGCSERDSDVRAAGHVRIPEEEEI